MDRGVLAHERRQTNHRGSFIQISSLPTWFIACRLQPTCALKVRISGKPEIRCRARGFRLSLTSMTMKPESA
jgi:hypothetical protein